ncbi:MAG: M48 family metalloprotease [Candidatus Aenigmarchaeota archaeon]|nr:M48 family metalloprotease [Candidatus Aenigmarchaeota archaeon]
MLDACYAGFSIDPDKLLLMASSLLLAIITLLVLKKSKLSTKSKIGLIYGHLIFLFFPFVVLTTNATMCSFTCACTNSLLNLVSLALPTTLLISTVAGFLVIPGFYMFFSRKYEVENFHVVGFVEKHSTRMKIRMPKVYVIDNANPVAFSFRSFKSMIFLSAGLIDLLNKKEIEAVILHELGHLKRKASVLKLSFSLLKFFSPLSLLARFHHDSDEEEAYADKVAIRIQKTYRYLKSAKRKIDEFERIKFTLK